MEHACCRRRTPVDINSTNKRGGVGGSSSSVVDSDAASASGCAFSASGAAEGGADSDAEDSADGSAAKRPRGSPPSTPLDEQSAGIRGSSSGSVDAGSGGTSRGGVVGSTSVAARVDSGALTAEAEVHASSSSSASAPRRPVTAQSGPTVLASLFDGLPRQEVVRLLLQALAQLDLPASRAALEREAGLPLEPHEVASLRRAVLAADWAEATTRVEDMHVGAHVSQPVRYLFVRQKLLELLARGASCLARACWAEELTPTAFDADSRGWLVQAKELLSCSSEDLATESSWRLEGSREALWERVQDLLPPHLVVPPRRLSVLLWQALRYQELHCLHHHIGPGLGGLGGISLLSDHLCEPAPLPTHCVARLNDHTDEVWFVTASNSGRYIASSSKDKAVLLWEHFPPTYKALHVLREHTEPCSVLAWSRDDQYLLTASGDGTARLWNPADGLALRLFDKHNSPVTGAGWLSDSQRILTAGHDRLLRLWHVDGTQLHQWEFPGRIQDLAVTQSGTHAVVVNSDRNLKVLDVISRRELPALPDGDAITSICASRLRDDVLVNVAHQVSSSQKAPVIRLWDVASQRVVQRYLGHSQGRFVVRSAFGGACEEFVVSGSEDAKVYIWHRRFGSLVHALAGHTATVNSVCWVSPRKGGDCTSAFLVSASDDRTMCIWGPAAAVIEVAEGCSEALPPSGDQSAAAALGHATLSPSAAIEAGAVEGARGEASGLAGLGEDLVAAAGEPDAGSEHGSADGSSTDGADLSEVEG